MQFIEKAVNFNLITQYSPYSRNYLYRKLIFNHKYLPYGVFAGNSVEKIAQISVPVFVNDYLLSFFY